MGPDGRVIKTIRYTKWEHVKGELQGILHTYWEGAELNVNEKHKRAKKLFEEFIKNVDDNGVID